MTTPRWLPQEVRAAWEKERDEFAQDAQRIEAEAQSYDRMAATLTYDPSLAQHYRDLAARDRQRECRNGLVGQHSRSGRVHDRLGAVLCDGGRGLRGRRLGGLRLR